MDIQNLNRDAHIHLMGICGVGMSSLAGMLKERGYAVTGSDQHTYPPISTFLERRSIPVQRGYSPSNLHPVPDLVVVGNVITRDNPEARELLRLDIPYLSMPQALKGFAMEGKRSIVIAGTHGKTTVTALVSWILEVAGMQPSFMIGGIARNFTSNFKLGNGPYFVIEGDEYDTAFFDKGPKFLHYDPRVVTITSIEFDHGDIYKGIDEIRASFRRLINIIPPTGLLCANIDDPTVADEISHARCPSVTYAISKQADLSVGDMRDDGTRTRLTIIKGNRKYVSLATELYGNHNISNILGAISIADHLKIQPEAITKALDAFKGVRRRLESIGNFDDTVVIDDFAHHPSAVRETTKAVKDHYKGRRLIAVFEPRSNSSRRNIFQNAYVSSFKDADLVILAEPPMMEKIPMPERFSSVRLAADLNKLGIEAHYFSNNNALIDGLVSLVEPGDVILIMSNGAFDNVPRRLLKRLKDS
ncbi:MAG: UDP-N-acetylmuramate:L-alanyl-gamma-D-glutamyl-meso-diaminopimelate ligase [Deltaproteobacteria bacterium]|nr:MAG: UDP-N-acetylmuramate:L-alanyl-gamma-D-glutamyl-meso-diaminopimelate ligase [Deltaproteobacteria bacterium]